MSRETDLSEETMAAERSAGPDLEDLALDEDYALTANFVDMVIDAADRGDGRAARRAGRGAAGPPTSPT